MHYYKFNIKDWTRDTAHLSVEEEGVYRRLLDLYYESESPIPLETQSVIRRLRLGSHVEAVGLILSEFFREESDGYHHTRCDTEIAKYHAKAGANRENGKKGGRPEKPKENPDGFQKEPTDNLNHKPLTTNQEPSEKPPLSPSEGEKKKRNSRIPDPFMLTAEMRAWAAEKTPAVDLKTDTENFVDYWRGTGGTKADWVATWRTWMRKAQKDSQKGARNGFQPINKQQQVEDANARVVQEIIQRESMRANGESIQGAINLGEPVTIEGEVIHAH